MQCFLSNYRVLVLEENHYYPFGLTISESSNNPALPKQPYKYQGIELNRNFGLETYETFYRGLDPQIGRFNSIDPKAELTYNSSPFAAMENNPVMNIDPMGDVAGDYYTSGGGYLGNDGINDDKVYIAQEKVDTKNDDGTVTTSFTNTKEVPISHSEMQKQAATVYGESTAYKSGITEELAQEMGAIAYVHKNNKIAYAASDGNEQVALFKSTPLEKRTGKFQLANWAVLNAATGGLDYSNKANMWDGAEQSMYSEKDKRASTGKYELHMNTMGWSISDTHYSKWKKAVGASFKAPQIRIATTGMNKGKIRLQSTAVYNRTIFWKSN